MNSTSSDKHHNQEPVSDEEILIWKVRLLGFIYLIGSIMSVLGGFGLATAGDSFDISALICFSAFGAFLFKARNGVLFFERSGWWWGLAASIILIILFPIGTAVGVFGIITLRKAKYLYGFEPTKKPGFRIDIETQDDRHVLAKNWEYPQFKEAAMRELQEKTHAHQKAWEIEKCSWSIEQETCSITFTHPSGKQITGPVQVIGTFNATDNTWMWAWNNTSIMEQLRKHSDTTRNYGADKGIPDLTTPKISCNQDMAWELASVACSLNRANGAYRAPTGSTIAFVTFGDLTFDRA